MKRSAFLLLSATACILVGCGQKTETTNDTTTTVTANGTDTMTTTETNSVTGDEPAPAVLEGQDFANKAGASDAFEVESSKLAATNGGSAAVKKFATQMITAHTESTTSLTAIGARLSPPITPDATLTADQAAKLAALKTKQGAAFDTAYVDEQIAAHEAALSMLQAYGATGAVPEFKTFAAGLAPKVAAHLNMAKGLKP